MRIRCLIMLLALLAGPAAAQSLGPMVTAEPVPWRDGTVRIGDAEAQVRAVAGKAPDRALSLFVGDNFPIGEQWMFIGGAGQRELLWVELIRGRVSRVWTEPIGAQQPKP